MSVRRARRDGRARWNVRCHAGQIEDQRRQGAGTDVSDPLQDAQLGRSRVTAGSQSPGIGRVLRVTKGHQPGRFRIREDVTGVCRTREDTSSPRFGTVRPRVQIPGPRPKSDLKPVPADLGCSVASSLILLWEADLIWLHALRTIECWASMSMNWGDLIEREQQVVRHLARGLSHREIAREINVR